MELLTELLIICCVWAAIGVYELIVIVHLDRVVQNLKKKVAKGDRVEWGQNE